MVGVFENVYVASSCDLGECFGTEQNSVGIRIGRRGLKRDGLDPNVLYGFLKRPIQIEGPDFCCGVVRCVLRRMLAMIYFLLSFGVLSLVDDSNGSQEKCGGHDHLVGLHLLSPRQKKWDVFGKRFLRLGYGV